MPPSLASFADELEKLAYGMDAARRVLRLAKAKQLPKASSRKTQWGTDIERRFQGSNISVQPSATLSNKDLAHRARIRQIDDKSLRLDMAANRRDDLKNMSRGESRIVPGRGDMVKAFQRQLPDLPSVPGSSQEMLQSVIKGHELDEIAVKSNLAFKGFGHRSPDVILREHNRVMTLPPEHDAVKRFMAALRVDRETPALSEVMGGRFRYGESPRLSRHARKRISEAAERYSERMREQMLKEDI